MKDEISEKEYKALEVGLLKRLLVFLKPYKFYVFGAALLAILASAITPLRPYLIKITIDEYISRSNWNGLLLMIILIFGLLILSGILQFSLSYLMNWVGQNVLLNMRKKLFNHIQTLNLKFFDNNPVGRLVTRVTNDIEVLNDLFSSGVVMVFADILLILWIVGFMFFINVKLALLTLTVLPLLILSSIIFKNKIRKVFREQRAQLAKINSFLNEFISGITTVKLFNQEENRNKIFIGLNRKNTDLWTKTVFYYAVFYPIVEMLSTISLGIILWYTAANILSKEMTIGILIAFLQYAEMFFRPIRDLTEKYTTLQSAMASSERVFSLLDSKEFIPIPDNPQKISILKKGIVFKDVHFSYDNIKTVLKGVSFEINKGETVAIVGATGAGKTSIINLICRFYEFQKGEILIDDNDIRELDIKSLRKIIALVMQDVFLFSRTVSENISLGNEKINDYVIRNAAISLGSEEFIEKLPKSFDTQVLERGASLSSGQRQLLSFCRAYAANPEILILDEATSNIDSHTESVIEKSLEKLCAGRTSLIIAHRLSTIKRANKIIVMHKGEIREVGTHTELLALNGIYTKLYNLQFRNS